MSDAPEQLPIQRQVVTYRPGPAVDTGGRTPYVDVAPAAQPATLAAALRAARQSRRLLAVCTLLGIAAGVLLSLPQRKLYRATSLLEVQGYSGSFLNAKPGDSPSSDDGASEGYIQTQIKLLSSRPLIERTVAKLLPRFGAAEIAEEPRPQGNRTTPADGRNRPVEAVSTRLKVRALGTTRIIELAYESHNARLAAAVLNTLGQEFIANTMEKRIEISKRTGEWLSDQVETLKATLERSESELQAYARTSGLVFTAENDNLADAKLRQIQEALVKAQEARVVQESQYGQLLSSPPGALPEVLDDNTLRDYQLKLTDLKRQAAQLSTTLTPSHYKLKQIQAQIAELEAAWDRGRRAVVARMKNEYQAAAARERLLAHAYAEQAGVVSSQAEKSVRYNMLKRQVDTDRALYENVLQRANEAKLGSAYRSSNVFVAEPAKAPVVPFSPNFGLNAGLGMFGGLATGIIIMLLRRPEPGGIHEPGDAFEQLCVPELGAIPWIPALQRSSQPFGNWFGRLQNRQKSPPGLAVATWKQKDPMILESFRSAFASVLFSRRRWPGVIAITSAHPEEGKTTVAGNLAVLLAEMNRKVLLVDGDFRRPKLHDLYNLPNTSGFSKLLLEEGSCNKYIADTIGYPTAIPGLRVLPAGSGSDSAAQLLYQPRIADLLLQFRREFDAVIVDTPPVLSVADARSIARLADGTIVVIRAGGSNGSVAAAIQRLTQDGCYLLGTILNRWDARGSMQGKYAGTYYDRTRAEQKVV